MDPEESNGDSPPDKNEESEDSPNSEMDFTTVPSSPSQSAQPNNGIEHNRPEEKLTTDSPKLMNISNETPPQMSDELKLDENQPPQSERKTRRPWGIGSSFDESSSTSSRPPKITKFEEGTSSIDTQSAPEEESLSEPGPSSLSSRPEQKEKTLDESFKEYGYATIFKHISEKKPEITKEILGPVMSEFQTNLAECLECVDQGMAKLEELLSVLCNELSRGAESPPGPRGAQETPTDSPVESSEDIDENTEENTDEDTGEDEATAPLHLMTNESRKR